MSNAVLFENDELMLTRLTFNHAPECGKRRGRSDYGYELYLKQANAYAFIEDMDARALALRIEAWRGERTPEEDEVVHTLADFAAVAGLHPVTPLQ